MKKLIFCLLSAASLISRQDTPKKSSEIQELKPLSNAELIRNPMSGDASDIDLKQAPHMTFKDTLYDFGEINEGKEISYAYEFVNDGKQTLLIAEAKSSCGCTVPKWPQKPIPPGDSGKINIVFNSLNRTNHQSKTINIFANTVPNKTTLYLQGNVLPKSKK